mmetsp:Transcript_25853/g.77194  ORF Transcript_25853/g.77194 Transcript_25853/m.77194 type:complete len:284 (+) Transcript_25853:2046-2897(+)
MAAGSVASNWSAASLSRARSSSAPSQPTPCAFSMEAERAAKSAPAVASTRRAAAAARSASSCLRRSLRAFSAFFFFSLAFARSRSSLSASSCSVRPWGTCAAAQSHRSGNSARALRKALRTSRVFATSYGTRKPYRTWRRAGSAPPSSNTCTRPASPASAASCNSDGRSAASASARASSASASASAATRRSSPSWRAAADAAASASRSSAARRGASSACGARCSSAASCGSSSSVRLSCSTTRLVSPSVGRCVVKGTPRTRGSALRRGPCPPKRSAVLAGPGA